MSEYTVRLPDVGEGVAEAEIVEWHVAVGDTIDEDDAIVDVMSDKATIELPSPVAGTVRWIAGDVGDVIAVGSTLVQIDVDDGAAAELDRRAARSPEHGSMMRRGGCCTLAANRIDARRRRAASGRAGAAARRAVEGAPAGRGACGAGPSTRHRRRARVRSTEPALTVGSPTATSTPSSCRRRPPRRHDRPSQPVMTRSRM